MQAGRALQADLLHRTGNRSQWHRQQRLWPITGAMDSTINDCPDRDYDIIDASITQAVRWTPSFLPDSRDYYIPAHKLKHFKAMRAINTYH